MKKLPPFEERCPQCDYSLAGLPDNHHCPECGLEYECREFRIFTPRKSNPVMSAIEAIMPFVMVGWVLATGEKILVYFAVCYAIFCLVLILRRWTRRRGVNDRVALGRSEIVIVPNDAPPQRLSWREIGELRTSWVDGRVLIYSANEAKLASVGWQFFTSKRQRDEFIRAVEDSLAMYRAQHHEEAA